MKQVRLEALKLAVATGLTDTDTVVSTAAYFERYINEGPNVVKKRIGRPLGSRNKERANGAQKEKQH